jgi:predicted RNA-binding Zn ribbon-like protein
MGGLELVRDFVNTKDLLKEQEELATPGDLLGWCSAQGLIRGDVTASGADLKRAIELREALRQVLLGNTGVEVDREGAFAVLDRAARRARIELCFEECAGELYPAAGGITASLGRIVIAVHDAMGEGTWARLKACRASDCEWAFIDNAKNQSRAWCSMSSCGNREKARAFRRRHADGVSSSSSK